MQIVDVPLIIARLASKQVKMRQADPTRRIRVNAEPKYQEEDAAELKYYSDEEGPPSPMAALRDDPGFDAPDDFYTPRDEFFKSKTPRTPSAAPQTQTPKSVLHNSREEAAKQYRRGFEQKEPRTLNPRQEPAEPTEADPEEEEGFLASISAAHKRVMKMCTGR